MVKFMLPGFYEHFDLNLKLINMLRMNPEYFRDNTDIYAVYGNFQFCIFDGGRIFSHYNQCSLEKVEHIKDSFNSLNIPIRMVFTNNQLKEEHYYDIFSNMLLRACENEFNEIVISHAGLESYIKEKYPKYKLVSSTTKCLNKPDLLKEELKKDYKMVCLDYNLNKNMKMLKELSAEEVKKCEFLINPICGAACPNRAHHYLLNSLFSLSYGRTYQMEQCYIHNTALHPSTLNQKVNLTPEEIYNIYEPMGFQYYKIEGRTWGDAELAITYVYYMVKPEYQNFVLSQLLA